MAKSTHKRLEFYQITPQSINPTQMENFGLVSEYDNGFLNLHYPIDFNSPQKARRLDFLLQDLPTSLSLLTSSCNGLVCLHSENTVLLLNSSTRSFKQLPDPPTLHHTTPSEDLDAILLHPLLLGFGYSSLSDQYKVLRILRSSEIKSHEEERLNMSLNMHAVLDVHTVGTDSWRRVEGFPREIYIPEHKFGTTPPGGTLLKESLHWFIRAFKVTVSFDMGNEEFGRVSKPEFGDFVVNKAFLGVSNGCLCLFGKSKSKVIKVWVMNKYGVQESWTHQFSVMDPDHEDFWLCPKNILKKGHPFTYLFSTPRKHVMFLQNGEVLVVGESRKLAIYDPRNGSGRALEFHGIEDWDQTVGYVESLVGFNSD